MLSNIIILLKSLKSIDIWNLGQESFIDQISPINNMQMTQLKKLRAFRLLNLSAKPLP